MFLSERRTQTARHTSPFVSYMIKNPLSTSFSVSLSLGWSSIMQFGSYSGCHGDDAADWHFGDVPHPSLSSQGRLSNFVGKDLLSGPGHKNPLTGFIAYRNTSGFKALFLEADRARISLYYIKIKRWNTCCHWRWCVTSAVFFFFPLTMWNI